MEDFMDGLDCKLRVSGMVADSIMMGIVNSAMEHAFDKACSKEGVIERLNEKSRFCELAVMQLEWCLKFIQEETDSYVVLESVCEREKLVSDLMETRDRIRRRLEETEWAIWEKDRELFERVESELSLRQMLEVKERELFRVSGDEGRDGDFCELKNSVDQQFFNIKQKLEDERMNFTKMSAVNVECDGYVGDDGNGGEDEKGVEFYGSDCKVESPKGSGRPEMNAGFEKMGSDIDILKETLDLAFGMMGNAISLSEVAPMEQQWRWSIEKDTIAVVFRGFLRDAEEEFRPRLGKGLMQGRLVFDQSWSQFMEEIISLRHELEMLVDQVEDQGKIVTSSSTSPTDKDTGGKVILQKLNWSREKPPLDPSSVSSSADRSGNPDDTSSKVKVQDNPEELAKKDSGGHGSLVAEMIKNHETIIRKKSEELNYWLKGEILKERGGSSMKRDKDRITIKKRMKEIIRRLDIIVQGNARLGTTHDQARCPDSIDLVDVELREEVRQLKEEQEDQKLITEIKEDVCSAIFNTVVNDLHLELYNCDAMRVVRDDVCAVYVKESVKGWNETMNDLHLQFYNCNAMSVVKENLCDVYAQEMVKDWNEIVKDLHQQLFNRDAMSLIRETMCDVYVRETIKQWNEMVKDLNLHLYNCDATSVVTKELCDAYVKEMVKGWNEMVKGLSQQLYNIDAMGMLRETVGDVYVKEMVNEWNEMVKDLLLQLSDCDAMSGIKEDVCDVYVKKMFSERSEMVKDLCQQLYIRDALSVIKETVCDVYVKEMVNEWNEVLKDPLVQSCNCCDAMSGSREDICDVNVKKMFDERDEMVKDLHLQLYNQEAMNIIREEVCDVYVKEMANEWNEMILSFDLENCITEEINRDAMSMIKEEVCDKEEINHEAMNTIREEICDVYVREMVNEWNEMILSFDFENCVTEEINQFVLGEAGKDTQEVITMMGLQMRSSGGKFMEESPFSNSYYQSLEGLRERMYFSRGIVRERDSSEEDFNIMNRIREEVFNIVYFEAMRYNCSQSFVSVCHDITMEENVPVKLQPPGKQVQDLECIINYDVCSVLFRGIVKEWENEIENYYIESLIREDIYYLVIVEEVRDFASGLGDKARNQDNLRQYSPFTYNLCRNLQVDERDSLMQPMELSNCVDFEEDLLLSRSSKIIEQNGKDDIVDRKKLDSRKVHCEGILMEKDVAFGSLNKKLQLKELRSCLGTAFCVSDKANGQMIRIDGATNDQEVSLYTTEKNDEVQNTIVSSVLRPITEFSKAIEEFDCMVEGKLGQNTLRLKDMNRQLDFSVQRVSLIRNRELLYRRAFLNRCFNLQKAEAEVDLLGDEVDALLVLLTNLYDTLNHYSPVLQCHFQIMNILDLIRVKLDGSLPCKSH